MVPGGGRTPAVAAGVTWLGRVTQTLSLAHPPFPCFSKSCMLTWTEPACEQFGRLYLEAERRVPFCLWFCCVLNPFGIFSPSWESTYMNCRKSWGPLERCLSVGFTVKVKICFQGAVLSDKCILWLGYEWVARWNLDWDFFTIVSIILSFFDEDFFYKMQIM